MKADLILKNYEIAKERYAALGVDTDKAIATLEKTPISLHCQTAFCWACWEFYHGRLPLVWHTTFRYPRGQPMIRRLITVRFLWWPFYWECLR